MHTNMVSKKVIIAVAVVAIVVIVAVAAAAGGGSKDPDARYNYDLELNGRAGGYSADAGTQFAIVRFTVANDSDYEVGTSDCRIRVVYDGVTYDSVELAGFGMPEYQNVKVSKGASASSVWVYKIPSSATLGDLTTEMDSSYDMFHAIVFEKDTSLKINKIVQKVRYNYTVDLAKSFPTSYGTSTPSSGKQYAILKYVVVNDSYADGVTTSDFVWVWKVEAGGVGYTTSIDQYSHPGHQTVTVNPGASATNVLVFEIPNTLKVSDLAATQEYTWTFDPPVLELDKSLAV